MIPAYSSEIERLEAGSIKGWQNKMKAQKDLRNQWWKDMKGKGPMSLEILEWIKMIEEKVKVLKFEKYSKLVQDFPKK